MRRRHEALAPRGRAYIAGQAGSQRMCDAAASYNRLAARALQAQRHRLSYWSRTPRASAAGDSAGSGSASGCTGGRSRSASRALEPPARPPESRKRLLGVGPHGRPWPRRRRVKSVAVTSGGDHGGRPVPRARRARGPLPSSAPFTRRPRQPRKPAADGAVIGGVLTFVLVRDEDSSEWRGVEG